MNKFACAKEVYKIAIKRWRIGSGLGQVMAGGRRGNGWLGFHTAHTDCAFVRCSVLFKLNLRRLAKGGSACYLLVQEPLSGQ